MEKLNVRLQVVSKGLPFMAEASGSAGSMLGVVIGGGLVVLLPVIMFGGFGLFGQSLDVIKSPNITASQ